MKTTFDGFTEETIMFLHDLSMNNNRVWFDENKPIYEEHVITPIRNLVTALSETMLQIDPKLCVEPKIGKTISRIYRDVRFSKDKSPFRPAMWLGFNDYSLGDWKELPGFWFEISPLKITYGMGFYSAKSETMKKIREKIDNETTRFKNAVKFMELNSSKYKLYNVPFKKEFKSEHSGIIKDFYNSRNYSIMIQEEPSDILFSKKILEELIETYTDTKELYLFTKEACLESYNRR